jgi:hypothetical protein
MNKQANTYSHTHCQAAPAHAKTQAWQRVRLSQLTTKTTDNLTDEKEHRSDNITYMQAGVSCFVGQEPLGASVKDDTTTIDKQTI